MQNLYFTGNDNSMTNTTAKMMCRMIFLSLHIHSNCFHVWDTKCTVAKISVVPWQYNIIGKYLVEKLLIFVLSCIQAGTGVELNRYPGETNVISLPSVSTGWLIFCVSTWLTLKWFRFCINRCIRQGYYIFYNLRNIRDTLLLSSVYVRLGTSYVTAAVTVTTAELRELAWIIISTKWDHASVLRTHQFISNRKRRNPDTFIVFIFKWV